MYLCSVIINQLTKKGGVYEMTEKERLIFRIIKLLNLIETTENQPIINQIKGYLYNLYED